MAMRQPIKQTRCMGCGTPINTGFFCPKCIDTGSDDPEAPKVKEDGWKASRFSGEAKRRRQQQLFKYELATWGKRVVLLGVAFVACFGGWKLFGDRIKAEFRAAGTFAQPNTKVDATNLHPQQLDSNGNPVGSQGFVSKHDK